MNTKILEVVVNGLMIRKEVPLNKDGIVELSTLEKLTHEASVMVYGEGATTGIMNEDRRRAWFKYRTNKLKMEGEVIEINSRTFFKVRDIRLNEHYGVNVFVIEGDKVTWLPINVSMHKAMDLISEFVQKELSHPFEVQTSVDSFSNSLYEAVMRAREDKDDFRIYKISNSEIKVLVDTSDAFKSLDPFTVPEKPMEDLALELLKKRELELEERRFGK